MNLQVTRRLLAGLSLIVFSAACSGASNSLSPTGPTGVVAASSAAVNFSPNPTEEPVCKEGEVLDPITGECKPPVTECKEGEVRNEVTGVCEPPPPPPGIPCSPGYWKNHLTEFNASCAAAAALFADDRFGSCGSLMTALTCKGSDASCGRNAAAGLLNTITGCTED